MTAQLTDTGEIDMGSVKDLKLPPPDTHCLDDEGGRPIDVWSYSPELVRQIVAADRALQSARHREELLAYEVTVGNLRAACDKHSKDELLAQPHPYLLDGMRFKICLPHLGGPGKIDGIPEELGGRWVAFVAAENDCHMPLAAPQAQPDKPLKERPDFIAGYMAGMADGKALRAQTERERAAKVCDDMKKAFVTAKFPTDYECSAAMNAAMKCATKIRELK